MRHTFCQNKGLENADLKNDRLFTKVTTYLYEIRIKYTGKENVFKRQQYCTKTISIAVINYLRNRPRSKISSSSYNGEKIKQRKIAKIISFFQESHKRRRALYSNVRGLIVAPDLLSICSLIECARAGESKSLEKRRSCRFFKAEMIYPHR